MHVKPVNTISNVNVACGTIMENLPENFSYPRGSFNICIRSSFEQLLEKEKEKKNDERKAKPLQKPRTFSQPLISFDHAPLYCFQG